VHFELSGTPPLLLSPRAGTTRTRHRARARGERART
jgi:hypothetical protein